LFGLLPCAFQCGDALSLVKQTVRAESEDGWMLKLKLQSPPLQYCRERFHIGALALILKRDVVWSDDDVASDDITHSSCVNIEAQALESLRDATASDLARELRRPV